MPLLIVYSAYSQTTFEYLLSTPSNEFVFDIYEADNGFIYFTGFTDSASENGNIAKGMVVKLDRMGSFEDSILMQIADRRYEVVNILPDDDDFILSGMSSDATEPPPYDNCEIELRKINSNLEILSSKYFRLPPDFGYWNMLTQMGKNDDLLIGGSIWPYNIPYIFFYVIDEQFDSIKAKFYTDSTRTCYAIHQVNDSSYWMIDGIRNDYYKLDYDLSLTTHKYTVPHRINAPYGIKWDTDSSFYLAGEWNDGPDDDIGFFRQFDPVDSTNNIFNTWGTLDTLDLPAWFDALDFSNKDSVFIGGTTNFGPNYAPWPSWYFIIQTDSNLNVRWERFYGGDAYYVMRKIIASNDGGCIVAGTRYDYLNATEEELDIHILKLNNEGLLVGTPEEPAIEMREALVFPNPGTNYLKVRIAAQYKHSTFELFDMNGKKVLSQQINGKWGEVNTTLLNTGTYIYNIYNSEGLFESGKWIKQ